MLQPDATENGSWKTKILVVGAAVGAVVGMITAYLLARTSEESLGGPPNVKTTDAIKAGSGVFGIVRAIAALGDGK